MSNNRFLSYTYGVVATVDNAAIAPGQTPGGLCFKATFPGGQQRSWSNAVTEVRPVSPKQTISGPGVNSVDINSIIVVYPNGLNQKEIWYASVDLVTTINTAGQ